MSRPPHCPNPGCPHARRAVGSWFTRRGAFTRSDGSLVQRFECRCCRRHFSEQTLRLDYRLRLVGVEDALARLLDAGTSQRAAARLLGIDRKTVRRRAMARALARLPVLARASARAASHAPQPLTGLS